MSTAGWMLVAVILQAVFLAVAAFFAGRAYRAGLIEQRRAPQRRHLEDAIAELKSLARRSTSRRRPGYTLRLFVVSNSA